jgi:hypothetical protein
VAIETCSQRIILILSAAIPGQSGLSTFFKRSTQWEEMLICYPPIIIIKSSARGPPNPACE